MIDVGEIIEVGKKAVEDLAKTFAVPFVVGTVVIHVAKKLLK